MISRLKSHASLGVLTLMVFMASHVQGLGESSSEKVSTTRNGGPPISEMMGRPLFDDALSGSAVSVRVVEQDLNTPAPETTVSLAVKTGGPGAKSEILEDLPGFFVVAVQKTDVEGRVLFNGGEFVGQDAAIIIRTKHDKIVSDVVSIPRSGGVRFLLGVGLKTPDPDRNQEVETGHKKLRKDVVRPDLSEISIGVEYRVRSVEDSNVWFSVYYSFVNPAEEDVKLPREGIFIPHPENMEHVQLMGNGENVRGEEAGIRITGALPRGEYQTVVSAMGEYRDGSLKVTQELPFDCRGILVSMSHYPGVKIVGPGLERIPVDVSGHEDLRVYAAPGGQGPHRVLFTITGLPERSRLWAKLVVILAVFFLVAGLWGIRPTRETKDPDP